MPTLFRAILLVLAGLLGLAGCSDPRYDTSTPGKVLDSMQKMIEDGRPDLLPGLLQVEARPITFDDGVTEASAIQNVKDKLGDMLGRLWRVSQKLKARWPDQVKKELELAKSAATKKGGSLPRDIGDYLSQFMSDPFAYLTAQRQRLTAEDMTDGTATILWDDAPLFQGAITMVETDDGWRITFPIEYVQSSDYWPQTRYEWSVVASWMLGIESSLKDFERELDSGKFRDLHQASERVGRLIGESVVAQSIIYASMKQNAPDRPEKK